MPSGPLSCLQALGSVASQAVLAATWVLYAFRPGHHRRHHHIVLLSTLHRARCVVVDQALMMLMPHCFWGVVDEITMLFRRIFLPVHNVYPLCCSPSGEMLAQIQNHLLSEKWLTLLSSCGRRLHAMESKFGPRNAPGPWYQRPNGTNCVRARSSMLPCDTHCRFPKHYLTGMPYVH